MNTLGTLVDRHGVAVLDHLDRDDLVPTLTGLQVQGDVLVTPVSLVGAPRHGTLTPVGPAGVPVVRGTHTHTLVGAARASTEVRDGVGLAVAFVEVAEGDVAYLAHPEHGYLGIGPGTYVLRRQREQAEAARLVAD